MSVANSIERASYSACVGVINSGKWIAFSKLVATLLAKGSPVSINRGKSAQRASIAIECAL